MGGYVGVESEEGDGSRFWIELAAADPAVPVEVKEYADSWAI
jgi:signal transduction histidine kinase